jgi:hypothetical protein
MDILKRVPWSSLSKGDKFFLMKGYLDPKDDPWDPDTADMLSCTAKTFEVINGVDTEEQVDVMGYVHTREHPYQEWVLTYMTGGSKKSLRSRHQEEVYVLR